MGKEPYNLYNKHAYYGCYFLFSVLLTINITYITVISIKNSYYNETICYVNEVIYPKNNSYIYNINEYWYDCYDYSDNAINVNPCIRIMVNIENNNNKTILLLENTIIDEIEDCTFSNNKCINNDKSKLLEYSYNKFLKYYNTTIDCYVNSDNTEAYLNKYIDFKFIGAFLICAVINCICCSYYYFTWK